MNKNSYNVSIAGSGISFMAGACVCAGGNLLQLYYQIVIKNKIPDKDYITKISSIAFLGGGMTSFGLYFLVPNTIRTLWF
jgi:hypothetical protein